MYTYLITYPLILISSSTAIFNLPINSFCPPGTALVLTSDNFNLIFTSSPLFLFFLCFFTVHSNIFILFGLRKTSASVKMYQLSFCGCICAIHMETSSFLLNDQLHYKTHTHFDTITHASHTNISAIPIPMNQKAKSTIVSSTGTTKH